MRNLIPCAQFWLDVKLTGKRGNDINHLLGGEWNHYRDCHIEPDWLLIIGSTETTSTWFVPARTPISSEGTRAFDIRDSDRLGLIIARRFVDRSGPVAQRPGEGRHG